MRRTIEVRLRRAWPPRARTVTVHSLTYRRYRDFLEAYYTAGMTGLIKSRAKDPDVIAVLKAIRDDRALIDRLAEIFCPDEQPGFYRPFHDPSNNGRMLDAALATNDWQSIGTVVDLTGQRKTGVSLDRAVTLLCREYPGMLPWQVHERYVDEVIGMSAGLREREEAAAQEEIATIDRDGTRRVRVSGTKPTPLSALAGMPGVVH